MKTVAKTSNIIQFISIFLFIIILFYKCTFFLTDKYFICYNSPLNCFRRDSKDLAEK